MGKRISPAVARALVAGPVLALLLGGVPAAADEGAPPPGVARVSALQGEVDLRRGDSGDAVAAAINAPLFAGDELSTLAGARAEVQFDFGNALRAGPDSELRLGRIDAAGQTVQLAQGTVELSVSGGTDVQPEVDTPLVSVRPNENGRYRISVTEDGNTLVTVRSGRAEVASSGSTRTVAAGSTLLAQSAASRPSLRLVQTVAVDDFDRWNDELDRIAEAAISPQYVNGGVVGAADLDAYGRWVSVPGYGDAWAPYVDPGWAPYRSGRWVWTGYYGWTWVAGEPWGWAPYHYGRWFHNAGYGWCWSPGPVQVRPVWQPALVAFFAFGGGGGVSIGFGNIGWVPLAPNEPFHPWWGGHVTNVTNINIYNVYRNAGAPGAVTAVSNGDFAGGRFNRPLRVTPVEMRRMIPVAGAVPVVPNRHSLALSDRPAAQTAAAPAGQRFSRFAPPTKPVGSFPEQRAGVTSIAPVAGGNVTTRTVSPVWRRFDTDATSSTGGSSRPQTSTMTAAPAARGSTPSQGSNGPHQVTTIDGSAASREPDRFTSGNARSSVPVLYGNTPVERPRRTIAPPSTSRADTAPPATARADTAPPSHARADSGQPQHLRAGAAQQPSHVRNSEATSGHPAGSQTRHIDSESGHAEAVSRAGEQAR